MLIFDRRASVHVYRVCAARLHSFIQRSQIFVDNLPESITEAEVRKLAEVKGGPVSQSEVANPSQPLLELFRTLLSWANQMSTS